MTWQEAVMGASGMAFVLVITVVLIMQGAATWRARMAVAREEAHRRLAEDATRAQRETASQLEKVLAELAVIREKTSALERALAEVGEPWQPAR
jgi:Tfp pilus assembly protein PilO